MADRIGQQLGNYRLVRLLGSGGFAEVYLGVQVHLGTQVAIKLLHAQLATVGELEQFRTEAQTIARSFCQCPDWRNRMRGGLTASLASQGPARTATSSLGSLEGTLDFASTWGILDKREAGGPPPLFWGGGRTVLDAGPVRRARGVGADRGGGATKPRRLGADQWRRRGEAP